MDKRILIALGGNALGNNISEQKRLVKLTGKNIIKLVLEGYKIIITHGNGPQVGMINKVNEYAKDNFIIDDRIPLDTCVAMSQGYIGYDLQQSIYEELEKNNIKKEVITLLTQSVVDKNDEAFLNPTKPIGKFYDKKTADIMMKKNIKMIEDSGRGYREVVPSPKPIDILEKNTIKLLLDNEVIVIACGGGGIPVVKTEGSIKGVEAIVDKDFASSLLADEIQIDIFLILTAVENVSINFKMENEKKLNEVNVQTLKKYINENHFAKGSMLPKVQSAISFVEKNKNRKAIITSLDKILEGIKEQTGTIITCDL